MKTKAAKTTKTAKSTMRQRRIARHRRPMQKKRRTQAAPVIEIMEIDLIEPAETIAVEEPEFGEAGAFDDEGF